MKTRLEISFLFLFFLTSVNAQKVSSVDIKNPINSIKYFYNNLGDLELNITLSEIQLDSIESEDYINPDDFKFDKIIGKVEWDNPEIKSQLELSLINHTDNRYNFSTFFQTKEGGNVYRVKKKNFNGVPTQHPWKAIKNISISYTVKGEKKKLPLFEIAPEIPVNGGVNYYVDVVKAEYYEEKTALIELKTEPPTSGTLISLKISDTEGTSSYDHPKSIKSENGVYKINITNSGIIFSEKNWLIDAEVDIEEYSIPNAKTKPGTKVFMQHIPFFEVIGVDKDFYIDVNGKNEIEFKIKTKGVGQLNLDFTPDIKKLFAVDIRQNVNDLGEYTFKISNLKNIPKNRTIYFDFSDQNGKVLTAGPHRFVNDIPKLSGFSIDISKGKSKVVFDLPKKVNNNDIKIKLDNLGITVEGETNIKPQNHLANVDYVTYEVEIAKLGFRELYSLIEKDTIVESSLTVVIGDESIYGIKLNFLNQQYIDKKIKDLAEVAAQKVNKKDKDKKEEKIKKMIEDIISIVGKVDEIVNDDEVKKMAETLAEGGEKDSLSKVMTTIGKIGSWVGNLGPLIIPLL